MSNRCKIGLKRCEKSGSTRPSRSAGVFRRFSFEAMALDGFCSFVANLAMAQRLHQAVLMVFLDGERLFDVFWFCWKALTSWVFDCIFCVFAGVSSLIHPCFSGVLQGVRKIS